MPGRFVVFVLVLCIALVPHFASADPAHDRVVLSGELARLSALHAGAPIGVAIACCKSIYPGDRSAGVGDVRRALAALGYVDADPPADPTQYDDPFAMAIRRYQLAAGLVPDGIVGGETRKLLQIGLDARIRMLQQSLDQSTLPSSGRFIDVNIAAGMLNAYEDGRLVLSSRVVVGAKDTSTPMFSAQVSSIWLNPAWVVPDSIVQKEFGGNPHTEQPGPANPLGPLLLSLPNRYEIFLHSTNEPALFDWDVRPFSHGCVRVQEVEALTRWLLGERRWSDEQIDAGLTQLTTRHFPLDQPVPVYLQYRTATVSSTGAVIYHADPYGLTLPPPAPPADAVATTPGMAPVGPIPVSAVPAGATPASPMPASPIPAATGSAAVAPATQTSAIPR